jgi:hypothetical protein
MESNLDAIVMAVEKAGYKRWQSYRQVQPDKNGIDEYLPGYYVCYAPSLSRGENTRALLDLEDRAEVKLIIGLTDALMEGKNLHMCNHLYMMDIPYVVIRSCEQKARMLNSSGHSVDPSSRFSNYKAGFCDILRIRGA